VPTDTPLAQRTSEAVAVVDLGANAVRCMLARVTPGIGFEILREARAQTRLGAGDRDRLAPAAIAATVDAVHRFLAAARKRRPRVIAVATAGVRDARNATTLLDALRRRDGVEVRVLSGMEEAALGALAVGFSLPVRRGVVLDLGGGSAQLARIENGTARSVGSVGIGAIAMTRRFFRADPPGAAAIVALRRHVREEAGPLVRDAGDGELVGIGGSIRAIARMHRAAAGRGARGPVHGTRLGVRDVAEVRARLEAMPIGRRRRLPGLKAERADTILAGVVAVEELLALAARDALVVCARGVRHGVLIRETFGVREAR
jgi:exopolyphosphatase/guanosine-5'-triphosphate,3'-diphosphate pyrophosphatase